MSETQTAPNTTIPRTAPPPQTARQPRPFHEMEPAAFHAPVAAPQSNEPVPMLVIPLLQLIQRTNQFLETSQTEFKLVRQDRCQELEYYLHLAHHRIDYDYLDATASDPTRRRYRIPPRLLVRSAERSLMT